MKEKVCSCVRWKVISITSCCLFIWASGCAAPAASSKMVPHDCQLTKKHPYTVNVEATGGRGTNPLWTSQISSDDFTDAVSSAIAESGLFKEVFYEDQADYLLQVAILDCSQPAIGLDVTVALETNWKLSKIQQADQYQLVWSDTVSTSYTAQVGEALLGVERLKKANEGAARVNIKEAIERLSMVDL